MATQFKRDCPHCLTKSAGFSVVYQWSERETSSRASVLALCGICNHAIVLKIQHLTGSSVMDYRQIAREFPANNDRVVSAYPDLSTEVPQDCPESVANFYSQGLKNLSGQNWDAAGAMFRKSLDVATKIIAPGKREKTLFKRINEMVAEGCFTEALGDWSHELRLDGNEAVHDEEPETEDDAHAMQNFAEAFLRYAFTLPNLVARNRAKRALTSAEQSTE